jgi:hypothetical protein
MKYFKALAALLRAAARPLAQLHLPRTTIVIAGEAKPSRERRAPYRLLDRRVAALLAMTIPSERCVRSHPTQS